MIRKKGYTLAEVIITLGVIGVIAAITAPLISKFTPDTNKITFLKTYDMLHATFSEIISNSKYYPPFSEDTTCDNIDCIKYPLLNTNSVKNSQEDIIIEGGNNKIAKVFQYHTGLKNKNDITDYHEYDPKTDAPHFIINNGIGLFMQTVKNQNIYMTSIYIDIDGPDNGQNCYYQPNESNCKKPDVYILSLNAEGKLLPFDNLSKYYILTRNITNKTKLDADKIKEHNPDLNLFYYDKLNN